MCREQGCCPGRGRWGCTLLWRTWVLEMNGMGDASPWPRPAAPGLCWWNLPGVFTAEAMGTQGVFHSALLLPRGFGHGCFPGNAWASFAILGGPRERSRQMLRLIPATFGCLPGCASFGGPAEPGREGPRCGAEPVPTPSHLCQGMAAGLTACIIQKSPLFSAFYLA